MPTQLFPFRTRTGFEESFPYKVGKVLQSVSRSVLERIGRDAFVLDFSATQYSWGSSQCRIQWISGDNEWIHQAFFEAADDKISMWQDYKRQPASAFPALQDLAKATPKIRSDSGNFDYLSVREIQEEAEALVANYLGLPNSEATANKIAAGVREFIGRQAITEDGELVVVDRINIDLQPTYLNVDVRFIPLSTANDNLYGVKNAESWSYSDLTNKKPDLVPTDKTVVDVDGEENKAKALAERLVEIELDPFQIREV